MDNSAIKPVGAGGENGGGKITMTELWRRSIEQNRSEKSGSGAAPDQAAAGAKSAPEKAQTATKSAPSAVEQAEQLRRDILAGKVECPACAERRYVDKSDDTSVSFQTPKSISTGGSKLAVLKHEREHVVNEAAEARKNNREIVNSSVMLRHAKCPDCGASYVAGGLTTTSSIDIDGGASPFDESAPDGMYVNVKI